MSSPSRPGLRRSSSAARTRSSTAGSSPPGARPSTVCGAPASSWWRAVAIATATRWFSATARRCDACADRSKGERRVMVRKIPAVLLTGGAAFAVGGIALERHEPINALWIVTAAVCIYLLGYRFYAAWIAARVLSVDGSRATPAERLSNGRDFVPTHRWIAFGHHFAAIAGPGPLVGPTLAAQFGYLPGTLWILVGAVLAGAVQDFVILFCSMRRDGKSIGQMAREEVSKRSGLIAQLAVLAILVILLAVVALVVV